VLEELIKKDKNLSTTTRTTTPATQIEDQMSQLRSSANIEATLMKNRQKMLKKEIYDIAEIIFKEYVLEAQFKPRDLAL
jgi:transcription elongation GreA/GreB family factor